MRSSENVAGLAEALSAWATEAADPVRASKGQVGQNRDYKYAALDDFMPALRAELSKHGIVIIQGSVIGTDGGVKVTRLMHKSGQWIETDYPLTLVSDPQKQGSADTYARRYGLLSALGLAPVDDDGKAASGQPDRRKEDPDTKKARQDQHDPSWEGRKGAFLNAIRDLGFKYDEISDFCAWCNEPRPSHATEEKRRELIKYLRSDAGAERYKDFLIEREEQAARGEYS